MHPVAIRARPNCIRRALASDGQYFYRKTLTKTRSKATISSIAEKARDALCQVKIFVKLAKLANCRPASSLQEIAFKSLQ